VNLYTTDQEYAGTFRMAAEVVSINYGFKKRQLSVVWSPRSKLNGAVQQTPLPKEVTSTVAKRPGRPPCSAV
jgi:hypothetical protein